MNFIKWLFKFMVPIVAICGPMWVCQTAILLNWYPSQTFIVVITSVMIYIVYSMWKFR